MPCELKNPARLLLYPNFKFIPWMFGRQNILLFVDTRMRVNLREDIRDGIISLAQEYHIARVILFGSRARGDNWERSDIDLAVSGGDIIRFSLDIDERIPTLLIFDIVNLDGPVEPELRASIEKEGVLLYEEV